MLLKKIDTYQNQLAGGIFAAASLWILIRVQGITPLVMQDEYVYSMQARKIPLAEQDFPNYLHSIVYATTDMCGAAYYNCAKTYNWIFFVGFVALIFLAARKFLPFWLSFLVAITTLLSPLSTYTSFFTPESMFFFFALLSLLSLWRALESGRWQFVVSSGAVLGLATLVKPHALLLLLAALLAIFISSGPIRGRLAWALGYSAAAITTKIFIGLIVAGPSGLSLFGPSYTSALLNFLQVIVTGQETSNAGFQLLAGSPSMPTLLAGILGSQFLWLVVALVVILGGVGGVAFSSLMVRDRDKDTSLQILTRVSVASLVVMVIAISAFGALVTLTGDDHSQRVLLRYIEFLVPLLLVVALGLLQEGSKLNIWGRVAYLVLALFAVIWLLNNQQDMTWLFIDSPWLKAITGSEFLLGLAILLSLGSVALMFVASKFSTSGLAILSSLALIVFGSVSFSQMADQALNEGPSDQVGKFAKNLLETVSAEQILIIGPDRPNTLVTAFLIDKPDIQVMVVEPFRPVQRSDIPEGVEWVIALGTSALEIDPAFSYTGVRWALHNISESSFHQFTQSMQGSIVDSTEGLAVPSQMGQRMISETAILNLTDLPVGQIALEFSFLVGPGGDGKEVTIEVEGQWQTAQLPEEGEVITSRLQFVSDGSAVMKVTVPGSEANALSLISIGLID